MTQHPDTQGSTDVWCVLVGCPLLGQTHRPRHGRVEGMVVGQAAAGPVVKRKAQAPRRHARPKLQAAALLTASDL
eukprot:scaffold192391_cov20-Tisochrysis_lutea.AAC.4